MFAAIRGARHHVHLEYYVFEDIHCEGETLCGLLTERRAAGVQIAIIYDAVGSSHTPVKFLQTLERDGVRLLRFNPVNPIEARHGWSPNRRDHRKLLIVDGTLGIVGGVNLSASYESTPGARVTVARDRSTGRRWRDTDLLIQGPAIAQLQRLFLAHWADQRGCALPDAGFYPEPDTPGHECIEIIASVPAGGRPCYYTALLRALRSARSRVWITAGYFLPTPEQKNALIDAARRRVEVRLLLPAHNDSVAALAVQRFAYAELLRAGVRIYELERDILHSKTVIIDRAWSAVGSSNFDQRSVRFNDEVDVVVVGARTANALARLFLADVEQARGIEPGRWRRRPWHQKGLEFFFKPWESFL